MSETGPVETIRDGSLKATIWANEGENGSFFLSTVITRTYTDERGNFQDANSFAPLDLLRVAELARQAYTRCGELKRSPKRTAEAEVEAPSEKGQAGPAFVRGARGRSRDSRQPS